MRLIFLFAFLLWNCGGGSEGYKLVEWGHTEAWGTDYIHISAFSDVSIFEMAGELLNSN